MQRTFSKADISGGLDWRHPIRSFAAQAPEILRCSNPQFCQIGADVRQLLPPTSAIADDVDDANLQKWENFIRDNKFGQSEDYFLQINTAFGWETVSVVTGYWVDWDACQEIIVGLTAIALMKREYRCKPANEK